MRLSNILNKEPMTEVNAVDNFASKNSVQIGKSYKVECMSMTKGRKSVNILPTAKVRKRIDNQCSIIPQEFAANGYQLFIELSEIVHSSSTDEEVGMKKYTSLRRLIVGILDNIEDKRKKKELTAATKELSWSV